MPLACSMADQQHGCTFHEFTPPIAGLAGQVISVRPNKRQTGSPTNMQQHTSRQGTLPVVQVMRKRSVKLQPSEFDLYIKFLTFTFENGAKAASKHGQEKWIVILDMNGFASSPANNRTLFKPRRAA
jgi:hypothetical protein